MPRCAETQTVDRDIIEAFVDNPQFLLQALKDVDEGSQPDGYGLVKDRNFVKHEVPSGYRSIGAESVALFGGQLEKAPPYYVGTDLIRALDETDIFLDAPWCLPFYMTAIVLPYAKSDRLDLPETILIGVKSGLFGVCAYDPDRNAFEVLESICPRRISEGVAASRLGNERKLKRECEEMNRLDFESSVRMACFAVKIAAVLSCSPELVEHGAFKKRAKMGPGGKRVDVFSSRWVGRTYRLPIAPPQGGSHASPRLHWRRGHIRNVRCGAGRKESRLVFVGPTLVGSDSDP